MLIIYRPDTFLTNQKSKAEKIITKMKIRASLVMNKDRIKKLEFILNMYLNMAKILKMIVNKQIKG